MKVAVLIVLSAMVCTAQPPPQRSRQRTFGWCEKGGSTVNLSRERQLHRHIDYTRPAILSGLHRYCVSHWNGYDGEHLLGQSQHVAL
jgi:hypothetical protein